jgi:lipopolysaccharide transport system permease protein
VKNHPISPKEMLNSFWRNRSLIFSLAKRDVLGRYRGSVLGVLWSFLNPLLMLLIYTFVFSIVFKARWNSGSESRTEFALILFVGLMVFNLFSECINRSPTIILSNVNLVKKVIFPLEILPGIPLISASFHFIVSFSVWFLAYLLIFGLPQLTILIFPLILFPLLFFTLGLSYIFSSLGVYIRDLPQILSVVTTILMFLTPIFYPLSSIPGAYRFYIDINPLTLLIEMSRKALFFGEVPELSEILFFMVIGCVIAFVGFAFFQKTRRGFADVL